MLGNDLIGLGNQELIELLATLEGMNDALKEQEKILKGDNGDNETEL